MTPLGLFKFVAAAIGGLCAVSLAVIVLVIVIALIVKRVTGGRLKK